MLHFLRVGTVGRSWLVWWLVWKLRVFFDSFFSLLSICYLPVELGFLPFFASYFYACPSVWLHDLTGYIPKLLVCSAKNYSKPPSLR